LPTLFAFIKTHKWLLLEFFLLCILLPTIIIVYKLAAFMFFFLWGAASYTFFIYYKNHWQGWQKLWHWDAVNLKTIRPIILRWIIASIGIFAFTWWYEPDRLFQLPLNRPEIIPMLLFGYTALSALPQEFVFCSFFFKRYAPLFHLSAA
tara:strand:+ start:260 stop:706 length:447 start_codon:yes stop_codon:yes gene_type:complete